jgi:hypothetical protein
MTPEAKARQQIDKKARTIGLGRSSGGLGSPVAFVTNRANMPNLTMRAMRTAQLTLSLSDYRQGRSSESTIRNARSRRDLRMPKVRAANSI